MRFILVLAVTSFLSLGCSSGGGSSGGSSENGSGSSATITGLDYSGTYISDRIACYNSGLTTLHTVGFLSSGTETIVIIGNSFTSTANSGACSVSISGTIQFSAYTLTMPTRTVTAANGGGCTVTTALGNLPSNTVFPISTAGTYSVGQNLGMANEIGYVYSSSTGNIGVLSTFTNSASPTDLCFTVYIKQ